MNDPIRMTPAGPRRAPAPRPFPNRPHLLRRPPRERTPAAGSTTVWMLRDPEGNRQGVCAAYTKGEARAWFKRHGGLPAGWKVVKVQPKAGG